MFTYKETVLAVWSKPPMCSRLGGVFLDIFMD